MRIIIAADSFPPLKNSAAVLVFSLAEAMAFQGHEILVVTPSTDIENSHVEDDFGVFKVLRIRCGRIKSHSRLKRGINELSLFFTLPYHFRKTYYGSSHWDLVVWYSPTIFLGGLVKILKKRSKFSYLILRDIVPDWMVDIGLMKKRLIYHLLKWFECYQYRLADVIGVQSPGNKRYIENLSLPNLRKLEVLLNWMPSISTNYQYHVGEHSYINLKNTILNGRKIFVYAGNLGDAQGIEGIAQLMLELRGQKDYGFLIIGRGTKKDWLVDYIHIHALENVLILDEVDLITLSKYYRQCCLGLVFLDPRHQSHNIPGKFISYLEASLPVAACINPGNDLINIISNNDLGIVAPTPLELSMNLPAFADAVNSDVAYGIRARAYYEMHYQPCAIAKQILSAFL